MKNLVFFLLVAVLIVSCKKQADVPAPASGKGNSMTFTIALPMADPVTYAIQTNKELEVKTLDIYQYDKATGNLDAVYKSGTDFTFTQAGFQINATITSATKGEKTFLFVANNEGTKANITGVLGTVKNTEVLPLASANGVATKTINPALMMTAETTVTLTGAPISGSPVVLKRIMSRFDIKNMEPALKITNVTLKNATDRSFVFPRPELGTAQQPAGTNLVTLPEVAISSLAADAIDYDAANLVTTYKHLFYPLISNPQTDMTKVPTLIVKGTLNKGGTSALVSYEIPLKLDGASSNLFFERNTRYTLVIKNALTTMVDANIKVDLWDTELITAPLVLATPKISQPWQTSATTTYSAATQTMTTDKVGTSFYIGVIANTKTQVTSNVPWITITSVVVPNVDYSHIFVHNVAENTTGVQRTGIITYASMADPTKLTTMTVVQNP